MPEGWSCCLQFALVLWNPNDPSLYVTHTAHHRFTADEGDWGFTRFVEQRRMFNVPWEGSSRPLCENETVNITAYLRFVEDETGVLWHTFAHYDSRKETGYVGLKNQGATCYFNSLLQSLYFTNVFRQAVYDIPTEPDEPTYALQRLFYSLQTSDLPVSTGELTKTYGWDQAQIFDQHDLHELKCLLLDKLEIKVEGTNTKREKIIRDVFRGSSETFISCVNVDYESRTSSTYLDIIVEVRGNNNLDDSLKQWVLAERLEGDDQYFAGDEFGKQDADKGDVFTSFPDVMHVSLKRFDYDLQRGFPYKINDRHEFPECFDAAPYLKADTDKSESWEYQLHGVLVHSGEDHAGHYYAFLKPTPDGWFYKFDDDKVTRATMREVMEDNFGGVYVPPANFQARGGQLKKPPVARTNNAYMLVYIRKSRVAEILSPITLENIPERLRASFEEEIAVREARRKEQREAHLYINVKAVTPQSFSAYGGTDLCRFDAQDESAPKTYRVLRTMTIEELVAQIAEDVQQDPRHVRLWVLVGRENKTVRPDKPIMDLTATVESTYSHSAAQRDPSLRVWVEVAEEKTADGEPIWASFQNALSVSSALNVSKEENLLLFLKYYDVQQRTLTGVGHVYVSREKKVDDMIPLILKAMSWPDDTKLLLWEEIKPNMIDALKPRFTLKMAELMNGDIVTFQLAPDKDAMQQDGPDAQPLADARDYYDFLENSRVVHLLPHPSRGESQDSPGFDLTLSSKMNYDTVVEHVGAHLGVPATHLRLWTVSASNLKPKTAVRRGTNPTLRQILNPMGTSTLGATQRSDCFFFEVLEMSLAELDTKKSIAVTWLSDGITKEEKFDVLVPKTGTIEDLVQCLIKKAKISDEQEGGRIRVYETNYNKFYREPAREHPILNLNEFTDVYAERVPEEEPEVDDNNFISVFHFQNDVSRTHGVPFKFLLLEGEKFSETKQRLEKRTGLKGVVWEKMKFALVRRGHHSNPKYLEDGKCNRLTCDDARVKLTCY